MFCEDCLAVGKMVSCFYDPKHAGHVCPRCERVYNPLLPGTNKHFASKRAAMIAMREDQRREKLPTNSIKECVKRILTDRF